MDSSILTQRLLSKLSWAEGSKYEGMKEGKTVGVTV